MSSYFRSARFQTLFLALGGRRRLQNRRVVARLKFRGFLASLAGLFLLTACSSDDEPIFYCPRIFVPKDSSKIVRFKGDGRDLTDVLFESQIAGRVVECDLDEETIEMTMLVSLKVGRGPADESGRAGFSYYVAVARSNGEILARKEFPVEIELPGNQTLVEKVDEVDPEIPLKPGETGAEYGIFIGFALSEAEFDYNRQNR